jgi:HSP20 family protein
MAIIPWHDPFEEIEQMMKGLRPFGRETEFVPSVDVYETKDAVVVESALAGVDPKDVEISIANGVLTLRGETKRQSEVDEKNFYRREMRSGSFFRRVALPAAAKGDGAEAEFKDGVLKITVPKAEEPKSKSIKIQVKDK